MASTENYLNTDHSLKSWLLTVDHKRIGWLYLISTGIAFLFGALFAGIVRLELLTPQGDLLTSEQYNKAFSMHGIVMVFFFLIPAIPGVLGNFLVPIMVGAKDMAFPKLNLFSWYLFMAGAVLSFSGIINGGVDTGWTFYTPYSSQFSNSNVTLVAVGIFVMGFSSILTALNIMVTVHRMRAPGMTWFRLPLFVWAAYATSLIQVLGTPVVAITIALVGIERILGQGIFDPALGGDPILMQHLFWFYSHPAVYIMILPAMGVISEIIPAFTRKEIFGYKFIAASSLAIAIFGFVVWGHHMFVSGQSAYAGMVFSVLSYMVAVPSAIKTFNWTATMYKGSIRFEAPMVYALTFMGYFLIGGLTGLFLSAMGLDVHLHDTYFVVAHFHYVMVGGTITGFLGGLHFWWPKITGKMYPDMLARICAVIAFIGFNLTFLPQFIVGYLGMPRRYHYYVDEFQVLNVMSTCGAGVLAVGFGMPILYFAWSLIWGENAPANPYQARGFEWEACASPPSPHNFDSPPVFKELAYANPDEALAAEAAKGVNHV